MPVSNGHAVKFTSAIAKLLTLPEFKVYIEELELISNELIVNSAKMDNDSALKTMGILKGISIATHMHERYVVKQ